MPVSVYFDRTVVPGRWPVGLVASVDESLGRLGDVLRWHLCAASLGTVLDLPSKTKPEQKDVLGTLPAPNACVKVLP